MTATIRDVAELAGCSIATVSRHVNGTAPISVDVRARVEAAVVALGYRPSEMGRSLRRQASRTIGVIIPSLTNPVLQQLFRASKQRLA
jgi:DNA-binding LacI/PurR family transcriptional regulator